MRRRAAFDQASLHLDLFVSADNEITARDSQDLMTCPFFSLTKRKRMQPIDFRMGKAAILVEANAGHGMATGWDADALTWVASQIFEARDAGRPTFRLIATIPHEIVHFTFAASPHPAPAELEYVAQLAMLSWDARTGRQRKNETNPYK